MDQLNTQTDYEFGGFRLDTVLQVLVAGSGEPIVLPARAYDALRYLVERAGELVDKPALMRAVWPNTVVEDNNLNQCILALRKALGETAGERRFILTVPGRGFKFVAPVRPVYASRASAFAGEPVLLPAAESATADLAPAQGWFRPRHLLIGLALFAAVCAATLFFMVQRNRPVTSPNEYAALTDLNDSATAPALSPDGKMLAFISGGSGFMSHGQIYLKLLPDGEPVRLTNASGPIFAPTFSADGTRVAYTFVQKQNDLLSWDTWTVPVTGGEPTLFLSNAAALSPIGAHQTMYSEMRGGLHMGIVTSTDDRRDERDIYFPSHVRGMAHYSYLSPDRRSVLVVEMDRSGEWQRCRVVPFDGRSPGTQVGPTGRCLSAAWSPDGKWMYFAADVDGHSHLWRQRYPDGDAQQITFGPAEEEGVAVAPDGRSLVTSLGQLHLAIWMHDASGERRLTNENVAMAPWLSADARRLYFLSARSSGDAGALWRLDIARGQRERVLPDFSVASDGYDISPDEHEVVFTVDQRGAPELWIAPLDRHAPPRLLVRNSDDPHFDGSGHVFYRSLGDKANYLARINDDGSGARRASNLPILDFHSVSPSGKWAVVQNTVRERGVTSIVEVGADAIRWSREGYWPTHWSADGKELYLEVGTATGDSFTHGRTLPIALGAGQSLEVPSLPVASDDGVIPHPGQGFFPGPDSGTYVFTRLERRQNIFRIPLH